LIDEAAGARLVVLHQGRVLAAGDEAGVTKAAGAQDLDEAFHRLTQKRAA
jgi:ABC-2 type transport system ATP-binding protein